MATGYIKLHRSLLDNPMMNKPDYFTIWCYMLLKASHKEHDQFIGSTKVHLLPGQFPAGRKQLSKETGVNEMKIYRILKCYENEHQIKQQKNNRFTLITILNWQKYQGNGTTDEQQNKQQMNNKRTTSEQPVNTNKNDKNVKNDKNKEIYAEFVSMTLEEYQKLIDKYGEANTKRFIEKLNVAKGSKGYKYKSDYLAILNWVVEAVLGNDKKVEIDKQYKVGLLKEKEWEAVKEKRSDVIPDIMKATMDKILK